MSTVSETQRRLGHCIGVARLKERQDDVTAEYEDVGWVPDQPSCYELKIDGAVGRLDFGEDVFAGASSMDRASRGQLMDEIRQGLRTLRRGGASGGGSTFKVSGQR